jgi:hypothetical protein
LPAGAATVGAPRGFQEDFERLVVDCACGRFALFRIGEEWAMNRIRRLLTVFVLPVVVIGVMVGSALSAPALADTVTRQLLLKATNIQFTSFTCLNDACSLAVATLAGDATSNLSAGTGTFQTTITVDFSPGGDCNIVDEPGVFTFDNGTIFTHSHHEDCLTHGLRIDTTFEVTGGAGAFSGATGSGREFGAVSGSAQSAHNPAIFVGTISF